MARLPWSDARDDERTTPQREPVSNGATLPMDRLTIGQTRDREPVQHRGRTYRLGETDVKTLVTLGTFRVVRADDLRPMTSSRGAWTGHLRHLRDQGLMDVKTVMINRQPVAVAVLTREGKSLLEAHQDRGTGRPVQVFHAGLVKAARARARRAAISALSSRGRAYRGGRRTHRHASSWITS